jgi:hypothetical protein
VLARRDGSQPSEGMLVGPAGPGVAVIDIAALVTPTFGALLDRRELLLVARPARGDIRQRGDR